MKPSLRQILILMFGLLSYPTLWAQSGGIIVAPAQCSSDELAQNAREVEEATLERVRQDMRAEGRVKAFALGASERDCVDRALNKAQRDSYKAIEECVQQTSFFRSCEIQSHRVIEEPRPILPVSGYGNIEEYKTDESRCRHEAEQRALRDAMVNCERTFNTYCRVTSGPSAATHKIERRRRYGLMGPKENFHVCHSRAEALPESRERYQCAVEISARVRL